MAEVAEVAVSLPEARPRRAAAVLARVNWPLVAIVVLGAAWTIWFVLQCKQYFIQPDELEYLQQSRRIGDQLHPILPSDRYFTSWSQLQPLLLAPVWRLFADMNTAHQVMGVVNALIMASTAIPAWLLTRRVVPTRWAPPLVALLSVAIPWMAAASTMMTEVSAYPAFMWAVFAAVNAAARPSAWADLLALGGVLLAFAARPQLAVVGPALVVAVLAVELRFAFIRQPDDVTTPRLTLVRTALARAVRAHWVLLTAVLLALIAYAIVRPDVFGGYQRSGVTSGLTSAPQLLSFSREILAYIAVGVGILPLAMAAGWVLLTLVRPAGRDQHAFAATSLVCVAGLTVAVGSFTARYTPNGINSRYLFYIAPLLFIGAAALVAERRRATLPLAIGGLFAAWVVFGADISQSGPSLVSPDQTFHTVLEGRTYQLGRAIGLPQLTVPHLLGVLGAIGVALLVLARRSRWARPAGVAALALVTLWCFAETGYSMRKIADTQKGVDPAFIEGRTWIDATLPDGVEAPVLLSTFGDAASSMGVWWDTSFWNARTGRSLATPITPDLQQPYPTPYDVQPETGLFQGGGAVPGEALGPGPWFIRGSQDRQYGFVGEEVVAERFGVQIVRTATPPRAAWALFGNVHDDGRIRPGLPGGYINVYPVTSEPVEHRRMQLTLATTPDATEPFRYRVRTRGFRARGTLAPGESRTLTIPLTVPAGGFAKVRVWTPGPETGTAHGQPPVPGIQVTGVALEG